MGLSKLVIALGGNALQESGTPATAEAQLEVVKKTCEYIAELSCRKYEIAIVHGNGPQVGRILLASEAAANVTPSMPFDVCGAMSQGYIGYHIQQSLRKALADRNKNTQVTTIVTQVVVDKDDIAFKNPTKPIGAFYSEEEAKKLQEEKGYVMKEDSGRGWRRVVASPVPKRIVEISSVKELWNSTICIAAGGGGIPVIEKEDGSLEGVAAVIDKDFAAEKLSEILDADCLLILTAVERVCINYNKPEEKSLDIITLEEVDKYISEGQFAHGSMLPKVEACKKFVMHDDNKVAIIASLSKAKEALKGLSGTKIVK
ncbi:MAG TPA: carbamate kinase [Clostridium sp.]|nr:carbamate kinase [Clostridium sp.]